MQRERERVAPRSCSLLCLGGNINEQHRQILAAVCKPEEILCVCQGWISPCLPRSLAVFRRFFARTGDFHSVSLAPSFSLCLSWSATYAMLCRPHRQVQGYHVRNISFICSPTIYLITSYYMTYRNLCDLCSFPHACPYHSFLM